MQPTATENIVAVTEAPKPCIHSVYAHGAGSAAQRWDIHVQEHKPTVNGYGPTIGLDVSNVIDGVLFRFGMSLPVDVAFKLGHALRELQEQIQGDEILAQGIGSAAA